MVHITIPYNGKEENNRHNYHVKHNTHCSWYMQSATAQDKRVKRYDVYTELG